MNAPTARLLRRDGTTAYVECPYCHGTHVHPIDPGRHGKPARHAPGCGIVRTPAQRLTGYYVPARRDAAA